MASRQRLRRTGVTCGLALKVIAWGLVLPAVIVVDRAQAGPDYNIPVVPLYQTDYPDKMDNSNVTIADAGCTLTAWTMLINYAISQAGLHSINPDGSQGPLISYTPEDINKLLDNFRYVQSIYGTNASGNLVVTGQTTDNGWGVTIGPNGPIGSNTNLNLGGAVPSRPAGHGGQVV